MKLRDILEHTKYLYKKIFNWFPYAKVFFSMTIILGVFLPFFSSAIPSIIVQMLTIHIEIRIFIAILVGVIFTEFILKVISDLSEKWLERYILWSRNDKFTELLLHSIMNMDYEELEANRLQVTIKNARESISSNEVGVELMIRSVPSLLCGLLGLILYATLLFQLDISIIIIIFLMCGFNIFLNNRARKFLEMHKNTNSNIEREIDYLYSRTTEYKYAKEIVVFQLSKWFQKKFEAVYLRKKNYEKKIEASWIKIDISDAVFVAIRDGVAYYLLISQVLNGTMSLAVFTFYLGIVSGFSNWVYRVINDTSNLIRADIYVRDYIKIVEQKDNESAESIYELHRSIQEKGVNIEFKNVSYKAQNGQKILSNLNFHINANEKIAIVGRNGAGKTTLVKLLCRLYSPTEGTILINGFDICRYNKEEYYKLITAVFQDINVIAFTVKENIIGSADYDENRFVKSAKEANFYEKIQSLNNKENSILTKIIDKEGVELSGGEKQRLMMARAIYKEGSLIILDEPTAALDPIAESELYQEYNEIAENRTAIFISHRLATTKFCSKIILMEKGKIADIGSHDDLMENNEIYREMYINQSKHYKETSAV